VRQPVISRIEAGERTLTPETAARLSVALKVDRDELVVREGLARLAKMADAGHLPSHIPSSLLLYLLEAQPTSAKGRRLADEVLPALVEISAKARRDERAAALKSRGRDAHGRRRKGEETEAATKGEEGPRRDRSGRRRDKPHAPRRGGGL
jgi:hypothetical protein